MTALSADTPRVFRGDSERFIHKNSDVAYEGSLMCIEHSTGHVRNADDGADSAFLGIAQKNTTGDGSTEIAVATGGGLQESVAVTGYSSAALNFKSVYATDDGTGLTLTRPADDALPVGITMKYRSSGVGDVNFFSAKESYLLSVGGRLKKTLCLGAYSLIAGTGTWVANYVLNFHGKLMDWYIQSDGQAASGSSGDVDLNLDIDGTNVTASQISVLEASVDATGDQLSPDSAMTATEFSEGSLLSVEGTANTVYTAGHITIFVEVELMW